MSPSSTALRTSYNAVGSATALRRLPCLAITTDSNSNPNPSPNPSPKPNPSSASSSLITTPIPIPTNTIARPPSALRAAPIAPVSRPGPPPAPIWFNSSTARFDGPTPSPNDPDHERKLKLGKTLRVLQERLPTLLQSPLPQEILSPNISLHLFPSTHPYLPVVSGRMAYIAALWTSPIAWNRVPIFGNVKLVILSERMSNQPLHFSPRRAGACDEQLVVKWRTTTTTTTPSPDAKTRDGGEEAGRSSLAEQGGRKLDENLRSGSGRASEGGGGGGKEPFTGLFIFEFDRQGKVISHTIEHVDEHGEWEKGVGAKVVGLTDWLLGGIKRGPAGGTALPLFEMIDKKIK